MTQYDDPARNSGTGMTTKESETNFDPNSGEYEGQEQSPGKKTSLFGRFKDKTKNKFSQIKSKVDKKMSGGTPSESPSESPELDEGVTDEDDAEEEDTTKDLPASVKDAPPASTTPYNVQQETAPASTELGTGAHEGVTESSPEYTSQSVDDFGTGQAKCEPKTHTHLQMQDSKGTTQGEEQSYTDKATEGARGLTNAAAGAVGYDKLARTGRTPQDGNIPNDDDNSGPQEKAQEFGQQASKTSTDAANTVNEGSYQAKDAIAGKANELNNATGDSQTYTQKASGKADELNNATGDSHTYREKAAEAAAAVTGGVAATFGLNKSSNPSDGTYTEKTSGKADELNNATGDSQTYREKAAEAAAAVTGGVAATLGLNKSSNPSDGTSVADKTRDYFNSAVGNGTTDDTTASVADTTKDSAGSVDDTAKDQITSVTGTVQDTPGSTYKSSNGHVQAATDSAKNYGQQAVDGTKGYMQSVTDMSKDYAFKTADQAATARNTVIDAVTPKDEHKALSDNVTATISNLPAQIKDSITNAVQGTNATATSSAEDDPQKEGGFLGRFTDLIFGKKLPEHEAGTNVTNTTAGETTGVEGVPASEGITAQQ